MALKSILILMDKLPHVENRLYLALELAKQHQASLVGLYVSTHPLIDIKSSLDQSDAAKVKAFFEQITSEAGIKATWQYVDIKAFFNSVSDVVNHHACFADLIIVGQSENNSKDKDSEANLPERVALGSGKPVLIVPYAGKFATVGERVLVAWKTGRESARAISDALPLFQFAKQVSVFGVNPTDLEKEDMECLCKYLKQHEVIAKIETSRVTELPIGDVLLNQLSDEGSDLLVIGAYAHTRFGSYVLGDVSKHVLKHMTVPVLISH